MSQGRWLSPVEELLRALMVKKKMGHALGREIARGAPKPESLPFDDDPHYYDPYAKTVATYALHGRHGGGGEEDRVLELLSQLLESGQEASLLARRRMGTSGALQFQPTRGEAESVRGDYEKGPMSGMLHKLLLEQKIKRAMVGEEPPF